MLFDIIMSNEIAYRIYIPNHHSGVFRSGSKFSAIGREATEPNFITVIVENLKNHNHFTNLEKIADN